MHLSFRDAISNKKRNRTNSKIILKQPFRRKKRRLYILKLLFYTLLKQVQCFCFGFHCIINLNKWKRYKLTENLIEILNSCDVALNLHLFFQFCLVSIQYEGTVSNATWVFFVGILYYMSNIAAGLFSLSPDLKFSLRHH